jgi:hypothetical protein
MRLFETYGEIMLQEFLGSLEETLITEEHGGLTELLKEANEIIFKKFGINPADRVYFIAGSARLYIYPELREAFNLSGEIGDLDIVIPNKMHWLKAGLEKEWNTGGIYRPTDVIEAFNVWNPAKSGEAYANVKVRSTNELLGSATLINGYYFMGLQDILDYKIHLHRDKEAEIVKLIQQYLNEEPPNRSSFLKKIIEIIGLTKTKQFLGIVNK